MVVHNGLVDLVFLYRSFYGPLPKALAVFAADLSEMFSGGVFDTKNMAEAVMREPASFLEYLFHKWSVCVCVCVCVYIAGSFLLQLESQLQETWRW